MPIKFEPLANRVILEPLKVEEVTKSGLVLPDTAKEKSMQGKVIAVGPGRVTDDGKRVTIDLKIGDNVIYSKFSGTEFKEDGREYLIVDDSSILAKIN